MESPELVEAGLLLRGWEASAEVGNHASRPVALRAGFRVDNVGSQRVLERQASAARACCPASCPAPAGYAPTM